MAKTNPGRAARAACLALAALAALLACTRAGGRDVTGIPPCTPAEGPGADGTGRLEDAAGTAEVVVEERESCTRTYRLSTTAARRDDLPANPRVVSERADAPVVRTGNDLFDALYALALEEVRELSVDAISDGAFAGGAPIACPPGGCFETGRLWTYVWTRDTAYAALLGLGALDPTRMRNSLEYKLSTRRDGTDLQIVQDTGTGGSYPVSTDRVVWAMGAWALLPHLEDAEREAFGALALEALANTAEHDRAIAWDPADGLYRGEQSFLDWREQSYPGWVAGDPAQIAIGKALGTNVGHYRLLRIAAALAAGHGDAARSSRYDGWADALAAAIAARFLPAGATLPSALIPGEFDPAAARRHDLLGTALLVSSDLLPPERNAAIVAAWPHLPQGVSVLWPQQKETPIYHNRAIWPFVSALWLRAAREVGNAGAVEHGVRSLVRGAALNLSNMENLEAVTGTAWHDDGPWSGPVVNSHRQLWSVAGYVSMVHEVFFGIETATDGIRFRPFVPRTVRGTLLRGANRIALSGYSWRGRRITVVVDLGDLAGAGSGAALEVTRVVLNGRDVGMGFLAPEAFGADNLVEVTLGPAPSASSQITTVTVDALQEYRNLFGPKPPAIPGLSLDGDRVRVGLDPQGETPAEIVFHVYRDGVRVAENLPGDSASWLDPDSADHASRSACYTVETEFAGFGTRSQHARPVCWWGAAFERIATIDAPDLVASGGTLTDAHGRLHHADWGDPGDTLAGTFTASAGGTHRIQLVYGNGAGPVETGVACAVKRVEVREGATVVGAGYVAMPQLGSWDVWRESSSIPVELEAGHAYEVVIGGDDARAVNMSAFTHFETYGGTGGTAGRYDRVNVAAVKVLTMSAP